MISVRASPALSTAECCTRGTECSPVTMRWSSRAATSAHGTMLRGLLKIPRIHR